MKILTNTQNYMLGWIPRVVKNILLSYNTVFKDDQFVTVNLEDEKMKGKEIKTVIKKTHKTFVWFYDRKRFSKQLFVYKNMDDIKNDFKDLIKMFDRIILQENPDLIILNWTWIIPRALMQASEKRSIPMVLYYHGSISLEEKNSIDNWATIIKDFEKSFIDEKKWFIFPSLLLKNEVWNLLNINRENMHSAIIPNSVPLHFFGFPRKTNNHIEDRTINIWFIMRWCDVKNKKFVVSITKYIQENNLNYVINLITDKEDVARKQIWSDKNLVVHPNLKHMELRSFIRKMDIVLCPSRFETYGNIAQESISVWTPALISENMWVKETFQDIWLWDYIVNFDKINFDDLFKKINNIIVNGLPKWVTWKLRLKYRTREINKRRYDFLLSYKKNI